MLCTNLHELLGRHLHIALKHAVICVSPPAKPLCEFFLGPQMWTPHMLLDPWDDCCPGVFRTGGNVLLETGIFKVEKSSPCFPRVFPNGITMLVAMRGKQAELCSLIQSPHHLLIKESCLMDNWSGDGVEAKRGIISSYVCRGKVALWLRQEMLIWESDSRTGFTVFLETQKCD